MPTRLVSVVVDAADMRKQAEFWAALLGWPLTYADHEEVDVEPAAGDGCSLELVFVSVADPKVGKNRLHLDIASGSVRAQSDTVARAEGLGARRVDIGQGDVPWVVMADPEGNEFCVLEPRPEYADTSALAAVVVDTTDVAASAGFWHAAAGWDVVRQGASASLRQPDGRGPWLEFLPAGPKAVKNRVHLDVAPFADDALDAEADRLRGLGATSVDLGQGDAPWVVLADPQGSEFCILSPR